MTLSFDDAAKLRTSGFLDYEIEQFASAVDSERKPQPPIELDKPIWQRVMASRRRWVDDLIGRDWTSEEIDEELMNYYRRKAERSPWDFLKLEYASKAKVDYRAAIRRRAREEITAALGKY